jgi:hypothetical protein
MFSHSVPAGGNDLALELLAVSVGAVTGATGGLATWLGSAPTAGPAPQALAAAAWVCGAGARMGRGRPAGGPGGRHLGGAADGASRCEDHLPGPGRQL